ncbi:MAG: ribonuclease M5 [Firmicutes bacterium]|nr:ribonuclease M5 [Bacillota bacterium]
MHLPKIEEIIVVEGRDDTVAIRQAVDAVTIETHGFGIREETWQLIDKAYQTKGIIVFTDPDTAGEQIRRRIMDRFPGAMEAFLDQSQAAKAGDIGIENASPQAIREALSKVHRAAEQETAPVEHETAPTEHEERLEHFSAADLFAWGLDGTPGASKRRRALGRELGIGHATAKTFLQRLNRFGISRTEIEAALKKVQDD